MIVAVDTGGTKTLVALFDTSGQITSQKKFPTPADISSYTEQLKSVIDELLGESSPTVLSIALPGSIVDGKMVWAGNLDWRGSWRDADMKALLSDRYDCPIIVENDANLAGLAEARSLSETPPLCLYVTISTGIGTGIITNGRIDPIFSRSEGGRIMLEHNGDYKIWERFASGKAIHATYSKLASEIEDDTIWESVADNIAKGMLAILPLLKPDIIIIGGGVGVYLEKFSPYLNETLAHLHDAYVPNIVKAVHPEEAVIYGCYYYALDSSDTA